MGFDPQTGSPYPHQSVSNFYHNFLGRSLDWNDPTEGAHWDSVINTGNPSSDSSTQSSWLWDAFSNYDPIKIEREEFTKRVNENAAQGINIPPPPPDYVPELPHGDPTINTNTSTGTANNNAASNVATNTSTADNATTASVPATAPAALAEGLANTSTPSTIFPPTPSTSSTDNLPVVGGLLSDNNTATNTAATASNAATDNAAGATNAGVTGTLSNAQNQVNSLIKGFLIGMLTSQLPLMVCTGLTI